MLSTPFEFQIVFTPKPMHRTESTTLVLSLQKFPRTAVSYLHIPTYMPILCARPSALSSFQKRMVFPSC